MKSLGRKNLRLAICILALSVTTTHAMAQAFQINISCQGQAACRALQQLEGRQVYDSLLAAELLETLVAGLRRQGYVLAGIDSLKWAGSSVSGVLKAANRQYMEVVNAAGKQTRFSNPDRFGSKKLFGRELDQYLNNGFPFARLYFEHASVANDTLKAQVGVHKGPFLVFDTLRVRGNKKTKRAFLEKYLFVSRGKPFSEKTFQTILSRINATGYLQANLPPEVDFYQSKAGVSLTISEPAVNQIDGVLGLLPNQAQGARKWLITGQLKADLHNLLGTGKHFLMDWQNFNVASQRLLVSYDHPVVLGSPLDFHGKFSQIKQDSTFITREFYAGFSVPLPASLTADFGAVFKNNNLLSVSALDTTSLRYADSRIQQYKAGLQYTHINNVLLPTRGIVAGLTFALGKKLIIKNVALPDQLYSGVNLSSLQATIEGQAENYSPLSRSSILVQQLYAGAVANSHIFQNDLFRLGGFQRLRGFNENQFYSSRYLVGAVEWRFVFNNESYLVSFIDQGLLSPGQGRAFYAVGFGGGMMLRVNSGIFRLIIAYGSGGESRLDITQPKVHFGFVNRF